MDVAHIVISFLAGIGAGFIGAISGGGGLLSIPALLFLGLPAEAAIATNRFAALGLIVGAVAEYQKKKKIRWKVAIRLIPVGVLGGLIGAKILIHINNDVLSIVTSVLLLLMIPVIFLQSEIGIKSRKTGLVKAIPAYFLYFLVMLYGGFFGGGAAMFAIYIMVYFLGMTYIEATATDLIPWLFMSATALTVFLVHGGLVNFTLGVPMIIGMYLGGTLGAKTAVEKGNVWVRTVFIIIIVASSIKLLFFR